MDFSKPENARAINRLKVLSALKAKPSSRAELSRRLKINKVTISEIADSLIKEGLIKEGEKDTTTSGRPSTVLSIYKEKGRVFSIEIQEKRIIISASNLLGQIVRLMQIPRNENYTDDIIATIEKLSSESVVNYGAAIITKDKDAIETLSLPFPILFIPSAIAEAKAEIERSPDVLQKSLFISWGDDIEAVYYDKEMLYLPHFGHTRVKNEGVCKCGAIGCLNAISSLDSMKERSGFELRHLLASTPKDALSALSFAIIEAIGILDARNVMITGPFSAISDSCYAYIQERVSEKLAKDDMRIIFKSQAGDKGAAEGGSIIALERFFYKTELLEKLKLIQTY